MRRRVSELEEPADQWDRLAIRVAADFLDTEIARYEHDDHLRDLNSVASPLQDMREVFDLMDKGSRDGWENITIRLETLGEAVSGYIDSLELGRSRGLAVAERQVTESIRQAAITAGPDSQFSGLGDELAESGLAAPELTARLEAGIGTAKDAYRQLADYLADTYLADAPADDAVGRQRYARLVYPFIGTELDLDETYAWGWGEIASLGERMELVADEIIPGGGVPGALHTLKTDPEKAAHDGEELRRFLAERLDEALERLAGLHFEVPDEIRTCDVKIAPPGGSLGAYYVPPSEDFTRPGSVWWSIDPSLPVPLYDEVSTAYHEGFPGHHLQCGVQVGMRDKMSRLQRLWVWRPGAGEGWALYAERLMDELGFLDTPDYVFGFLTAQMLRACRVVIDIGSHLELPIPADQPFHPGERWNFDTAVEMLEAYATLDHSYAVSEVTRYLGWPAQAISYKIGERAILDMRAEMQRRLGDQFDAKTFHRRLLEVGSVGLDLVRQHVLNGGSE